MLKKIRWFLLSSMIIALIGCAPPPPRHIENICSIFREYPEWYWSAEEVRDQWHIPISVLMSIIYQESHFRANARPPREKLLWIIPWFRPTSAYGYSQAVDDTWERYQRDTGNHGASRNAFDDAADFIGWYANQIAIQTRTPKATSSAYVIYLAYHEGIRGYQRGTYRKKRWLINVAHKVQRRAWVYQRQLSRCEASLPQKPWWHFW